jgi:Rhodopirellula transposase DDE domain
MTPRLRWTSKSLVKLSDELGAQGREASPTMVRRLMYQQGWRLQSNNKSMAKSLPHPDRNAQFGYISESAAEFAAAGQPVVSVDAKKKDCARRELRQRRPGMGPRRGGAAGPGPRLPWLGRGEGHPLRRL